MIERKRSISVIYWTKTNLYDIYIDSNGSLTNYYLYFYFLSFVIMYSNKKLIVTTIFTHNIGSTDSIVINGMIQLKFRVYNTYNTFHEDATLRSSYNQNNLKHRSCSNFYGIKQRRIICNFLHDLIDHLISLIKINQTKNIMYCYHLIGELQCTRDSLFFFSKYHLLLDLNGNHNYFQYQLHTLSIRMREM